jgi:hypothetical protein
VSYTYNSATILGISENLPDLILLDYGCLVPMEEMFAKH